MSSASNVALLLLVLANRSVSEMYEVPTYNRSATYCAQVSVFRRAHLGQDVFLGDVSIPLSEVDHTADSLHSAELRRYTLGRRSAKDKARSVHLFMSYREVAENPPSSLSVYCESVCRIAGER